MTINLDNIIKDEIEGKGGITTSTELNGDLTGSLDDTINVVSVRGNPVSDDVLNQYEGYVKFGSQLEPTPIVWTTLDTTSGGVVGNFDEGLNLTAIYGSGLVQNELFSNDGEGLVYKGGELYVEQLNPYRNRYITSSVVDTQVRDYLRVDCTLPGITIPCPASPSLGDYIVVSVVKGDPETNVVTLTATNIEGDTSFIIDVPLTIQVVYTGSEWEVRI